MYLGLSRTYSKCNSDICPSNFCQGDICPYEEYLICYWSNFDQTLNLGSCLWLALTDANCHGDIYPSRQHLSWRHLSILGISQLLLTQIFSSQYFGGLDFFWINIRFDLSLFGAQNILIPTLFGPKLFSGPQIFLDPKKSCLNNFGSKKALVKLHIFRSQNCLDPNYLDPPFLGLKTF